MRLRVAGILLLLATAPVSRAAASPIYLNPLFSPAERAADLISRMTLAEKAAQLSTTNAPAIPQLGVQEYAYWSEALHGVYAFQGGDYSSPTGVDTTVHATSFPTSLSASLTWDPALIRRETAAISDEARGFLDRSLFGHSQNDLGPSASDYGSLFYFAPTVNMDRDPRWGRVDESFGEDPLLTGRLGTAWVEGFQGEDAQGRAAGKYLKAVATLKHYALYNVEDKRMDLSSDTDEATIRDYYTRQFAQIIKSAQPGGVMSSYNAIDGVPAVADNLTLNVLLRRTFGFGGYVTSDCGAVGTEYRSSKDPGNELGGNPQTAAYAIGGHDWAPPGWSTNHLDQFATWSKDGTLTKVSGRAGAEAWALRTGTALNCVGDNGEVGHPAFWDPLRPFFSDENRIDYIEEAITAGILSTDVIDRALLPEFTLRMRTGEFDPRAQQPYARITKRVIQSQPHRRLTEVVADEALTLLQNNRPRGARRPLLPVNPARVKKLVVVGDQASKVFLGDYSGVPSEQVSVLQGIQRELPHAQVIYDSGKSSDTSTKPPALQPSTKAAIRTANLVVVMVGTDGNVNGEGTDRKTLALPGNYLQLVQQVAAVGNPRIVLLDQSAGPVALGAVQHRVASILFSAANGERQGLAAADVILGKVDPSGHLTFTWYAGDRQLPPMKDYGLAPKQTGGLGRTYMYFTGRPAYPFGYGLSYTSFRYTRARINRNRAPVTAGVRVSFRVTNTGSRAGATVAQLYAAPPRVGGVSLPREWLVGFQRTRVLKPGESQDITIAVPLISALERWSARAGREVVYGGRWQFRIGRDAQQVVSSLAVQVSGAIPRTIATVTLAPEQLMLTPGQTVNLRARNRWLDGLAPTQYQSEGDTIISAVRRDGTFVNPAGIPMRFASDRPRVVSVGQDGVLRALAPGVATISVTIGGVSASAPFVVS